MKEVKQREGGGQKEENRQKQGDGEPLVTNLSVFAEGVRREQ